MTATNQTAAGPTMKIGLGLTYRDIETGQSQGWGELPAMINQPPMRTRLEAVASLLDYWLSPDRHVDDWHPIAVGVADAFDLLNASSKLVLHPETVTFCKLILDTTDPQLDQFTIAAQAQGATETLEARTALRHTSNHNLRVSLGLRLASQEGARAIRCRLQGTGPLRDLLITAGDTAAAVAATHLIGDKYTQAHHDLLVAPYRSLRPRPRLMS